jgi:hypothetical protein
LEACGWAELEIRGTGLQIITILVRIASFFAIIGSRKAFFY